jgi:hypothetical protein
MLENVNNSERAGAGITVEVELFGVPRLRAGTARLALALSSPSPPLSEALDRLGRACPALEGTVVSRGRLRPGYRLSLKGERFVSDPDTPLADGDVLILLAADVGG